MSDDPLQEVQSWIEELGGDGQTLLAPLNLTFEQRSEPDDLEVLGKLSHRVVDEPGMVGRLLRAINWRSHLVATTCLLLSRRGTHFGDLCRTLEVGSMVRPQIAVAMALLNPEETRRYFLGVLESWTNDQDRLLRSTACLVLGLLGETSVDTNPGDSKQEIFMNPRLETLHAVLPRQWKYWSAVLET